MRHEDRQYAALARLDLDSAASIFNGLTIEKPDFGDARQGFVFFDSRSRHSRMSIKPGPVCLKPWGTQRLVSPKILLDKSPQLMVQ